MAANVPSRPAMDEAINALHDEVIRYKGMLNSLIGKLESPRPVECTECEPKCNPSTVGDALQDLYSTLVNCNDMLQITNRRIDEQIGELKLLP